jgi:hypothetical protein
MGYWLLKIGFYLTALRVHVAAGLLQWYRQHWNRG